MSNIAAIVELLKQERGRIEAAITALSGLGRRSGIGSAKQGGRGRRRRKMSAAARAKIAAAQRARWAKQKAAAKTAR